LSKLQISKELIVIGGNPYVTKGRGGVRNFAYKGGRGGGNVIFLKLFVCINGCPLD
jgi:hypothetical protein